jgi:hypothetical protein
LFERLLALHNDLGLLAKECDSRTRRFLGNFPWAFSHIGIINTTRHIYRGQNPHQPIAAVTKPLSRSPQRRTFLRHQRICLDEGGAAILIIIIS